MKMTMKARNVERQKYLIGLLGIRDSMKHTPAVNGPKQANDANNPSHPTT